MECVKQQAGLPVPRIITPDMHYRLPDFSPSSLEHVWNWTFERGIAALNAHTRSPESPHTSPKSRPVKKENDSIPTLRLPSMVPHGESLNTPHFENIKRLCKDHNSTPEHATNQVASSYVQPKDFLTSYSPWFDVRPTVEDLEKEKDEVRQKGSEQARARMMTPTSDAGSPEISPIRELQPKETSMMGGRSPRPGEGPTWKSEEDLSMAIPQLSEEATGLGSRESLLYVPGAFRSSHSQEPSASPSSSLGSDASTGSASLFSLDEEWEQEPSKDVESHPLYHLKDRIVGLLLERYNSPHTANQQDAGSGRGRTSSGSYGSSHQASRQDKQTSTRKRKAGDRDDGDDDIGDNGDSFPRRSKKPRGADGNPGGHLTFACPFSKRHPARHRRCYRYELKRIRDVKQHLRRCHRKAMYCPVCGQTFQDEETRDVHVRQRRCQEDPDLNVEGVTEAQRQQLAEKCSPKKSQEDQWFDVFDIIFPGQPRPRSPYVDRLFSEELQSFRDFLAEEGPAMLAEQLQAYRPWNEEDGAFLQRLLGDGFERIAESWAQRLDEDGQYRLSDSPSETASPVLTKHAPDQRTITQPSAESYQDSRPAGAVGTASSFRGQVSAPGLLPSTPQQRLPPKGTFQEAVASRYLPTNPGHPGIAGSSSQAFEAPHAAGGLLEADMNLFGLDAFLQGPEALGPAGGLCYPAEPWGVGALAEGSLAGGLG